ncbi:beta-1,3-galactosyltransferase 1-like [Gigantopelta aegis]|uniref:beta-1,3-galactosyltransferase 1-like n=1 Tax=Gigantopelta aegis TaxID=1735272 RepID=UPI001B88DE3C|nr:beta-1,3-galactosyltransferase 1-like [Gigantopelta aegis]
MVTVCILIFTVTVLEYGGERIASVDDVGAIRLRNPFPQAPHVKDFVVNPHPFRYLMNPETLCSGKDVFIITFVLSAPKNLIRRQGIRRTWGNRNRFFSESFLVVFILGQVADRKVMTSVKKESGIYGDIVQEDFVDSYRNLTYKSIAGLKWVSTFCRQAAYVLKTDDDIFVNMKLLLTYIQLTLEPSHGKTDIILGYLMTHRKVYRSKLAKWYIAKDEYPLEYYKPYCLGLAYLMSSDIAIRMYKLSYTVPFLWVEDYYITGLLAQKLSIIHRRYNSAYRLSKVKDVSGQQYVFYFSPKVGTLFSLWNDLMIKERRSLQREHSKSKPIII